MNKEDSSMTVLEATQKLLSYFKDSKSFNLEKDALKICIISLNDELDKAIILKALSNLEQEKLISLVSYKKQEFWVLNKSLDSYNQTLTISASTIKAIAEIINPISQKLSNPNSLVDTLNITENNIIDLILICQELLVNSDQKE